MNNGNKGERSKSTKRADRDLIFFILLLVLPLTQFAIFYIGVNANSFLLAFKRYNSQTSLFEWAGFTNFRRVWQELTVFNLLREALKNSLIVWFFSTFLGLTAAVLFSYYIFKKYPLGGVFKVILFLPSVLPAILLVMIFQTFANEALPGYLNILFDLSLNPLFTDPELRLPMVIFYSVWIGFGTQILIYTGSMEQVSPSVIEAAKLDGVSPLKELWSIVIPEVIPAINTFLITGIAQIFINQANLWSFFGQDVSSSDMTLGYYMFYLVNREGISFGDYGYASAVGLCCTLVAIPLTFVVRHFLGRLEDK